jgi:catechol 2,3-dioxygenase-like lactoylglutathione lyase family enzyme
MPDNVTIGFDHVGLTVADLDAARGFFVDCLGWKVVGGRPDYPSIYVSDGAAVLTLWQVENPASYVQFNRRTNVGLHHLALRVPNRESLDELYARVASWPGVVVEFPPQTSGAGPKVHMMLREPGGNRLELAWDPRKSGT